MASKCAYIKQALWTLTSLMRSLGYERMPETIENIQPGEIGATTVFGVSNLFLLICCQESERRRVAVTRPHLFSKSQFRDVLPFVPGPPARCLRLPAFYYVADLM